MIIELVGGKSNGAQVVIDNPFESTHLFQNGEAYYLRYEHYKQLNWFYIFYLHL